MHVYLFGMRKGQATPVSTDGSVSHPLRSFFQGEWSDGTVNPTTPSLAIG